MVSWASRYYQYPVGEAFAAALPVLLRQGQSPEAAQCRRWRLTAGGQAVDPATLARAPRQAAVIAALHACPDGLARDALDAPAVVLQALADKGWIESFTQPPVPNGAGTAPARGHPLNPAQQHAVDACARSSAAISPCCWRVSPAAARPRYTCSLIDQVLAQQRQALMLVPEIGLTPQLVTRFQRRFPVPLAVLHSGLSDRERLSAWQQARTATGADRHRHAFGRVHAAGTSRPADRRRGTRCLAQAAGRLPLFRARSRRLACPLARHSGRAGLRDAVAGKPVQCRTAALPAASIAGTHRRGTTAGLRVARRAPRAARTGPVRALAGCASGSTSMRTVRCCCSSTGAASRRH